MQLYKAVNGDFDKIRALYWDIIDQMRDAEYKPMWEKGVYPSDDALVSAINAGTLYYAMENGELIAAMVVNHNCSKEYELVHWEVEAQPEEVSVIHMLGVLPDFHGKGVARFMVESAQRIARENNQKVMRLDVLEGNLPAEKLYVKYGFKYLETLKLFYEDTGWANFKMYECKL